MENTITITLNTLHCNRQGQGSGGSSPYLWPAMLWVNKDTATVGVLGILEDDSHTILKRGMKPGDTVDIPSKAGMILRPFDDDLSNHVIIVTVALWQDNESPGYAVKAGYRSFLTSLRDGIASHLLQLNSTDPQTVDDAEKAIKDAVTAGVTKGISDSLSTTDKIKIATGIMTLDSPIDSATTSFSNLVETSFTLQIGGSLGGRLLFYRDFTRNGTGDVDTPKIIGLGGWAGFKFLFSGGDGILYAVNPEGQLLFYRDATQDGTGDVNTPSVIGQGGWAEFKFLFSGGNGIIYAVDQQGQLLFYRDYTQNGTGDVNTPSVIGQGGWQSFQFLFSGGDGIIYAVDQQGRLLFYRDYTRNGTGDVNTPSVIGQGGWKDFQFLFSGDNGIIYAAEKILTPRDSYEVTGTLSIVAAACVDERAAVSTATADVQSARQIVADLEHEFQNAPASQKPFLRQQIIEAKQEEAAAEQRLTAARQALSACLARKNPPRRRTEPITVA
jgi:hypothetical protein